jgi:HAD superfamily hydrolase (TIGR01509 family)
MDGVIVDSERYWVEEMDAILDEVLDTDEVTHEDIKGVNVLDQYDQLSADYDVQVSREEYFDRYDRRAETVYTEQASLLDGFRDLLDALADRDVPVAVATSSFPQWIEMVLDRFDLAGRFDAVVSAADLDGPGKPEPDIYEITADRLGVAPTDCVVVEDSPAGVEAATRAGTYTIGYQRDADAEDDLSRADEVAVGAADLRKRVLAAVDG